jgi:hypothetical protein
MPSAVTPEQVDELIRDGTTVPDGCAEALMLLHDLEDRRSAQGRAIITVLEYLSELGRSERILRAALHAQRQHPVTF